MPTWKRLKEAALAGEAAKKEKAADAGKPGEEAEKEKKEADGKLQEEEDTFQRRREEEEERKQREEAERAKREQEEEEAECKRREEAERVAREQEEAERKRQEDAERAEREQEEAAERKRQEEAERARREAEEAERTRREEEEAERARREKEAEEAEREAERKRQEEAERAKREEEEAAAERRRREEQEEAERRRREEEAERAKREEEVAAERRRREEQEEAERRRREEEAERAKREEEAAAERRRREEHEEAERRRREEEAAAAATAKAEAEARQRPPPLQKPEAGQAPDEEPPTPGSLPLVLAVKAKDLRRVVQLLEEGADPNIEDAMGETPIFKAAERHLPDVVAILLVHGADSTWENKGFTQPTEYADAETENLMLLYQGRPVDEDDEAESLQLLSGDVREAFLEGLERRKARAAEEEAPAEEAEDEEEPAAEEPLGAKPGEEDGAPSSPEGAAEECEDASPPEEPAADEPLGAESGEAEAPAPFEGAPGEREGAGPPEAAAAAAPPPPDGGQEPEEEEVIDLTEAEAAEMEQGIQEAAAEEAPREADATAAAEGAQRSAEEQEARSRIAAEEALQKARIEEEARSTGEPTKRPEDPPVAEQGEPQSQEEQEVPEKLQEDGAAAAGAAGGAQGGPEPLAAGAQSEPEKPAEDEAAEASPPVPLDERLARAVRAGNLLLARRLLAQGADPNAGDEEGETPLFRAAELGGVDLVAELLLGSADPNQESRRHLAACDYAGTSAVEALLGIFQGIRPPDVSTWALRQALSGAAAREAVMEQLQRIPPAQETEDPEWEQASQVIDAVAEQISVLMSAVRRATGKRKQALLLRARKLESSPDYLAAVAYAEKAFPTFGSEARGGAGRPAQGGAGGSREAACSNVREEREPTGRKEAEHLGPGGGKAEQTPEGEIETKGLHDAECKARREAERDRQECEGEKEDDASIARPVAATSQSESCGDLSNSIWDWADDGTTVTATLRLLPDGTIARFDCHRSNTWFNSGGSCSWRLDVADPLRMVLTVSGVPRVLRLRGGGARRAVLEEPVRQPAPAMDRWDEADFELLVRHAVDESARTSLVLPFDATFAEAKEALARQVGSQAIRQSGRLVRPKGQAGLYVSCKETSYVGQVRQVFLLGADLQIRGQASKASV